MIHPAIPFTYEERLAHYIEGKDIRYLVVWEVEDKFFEKRLIRFAAKQHIDLVFLPSPMFLTTREDFSTWVDENRPHMAAFYRWQRRGIGVLLDDDGQPLGDRWSFDTDNRKSLPKKQMIPPTSWAKPTLHVCDVIPLVNKNFRKHPGELNCHNWWLPTTRTQALSWLREFLRERFDLFVPSRTPCRSAIRFSFTRRFRPF